MISEYEMQSFWNSEIGKEIEKNKISVSDQWKEIERLNELNILLMSKR